MQKMYRLFSVVTIAAFVTLLQSCVKDTVTERYTFYRPVYKTKEAVFDNIKSGQPEVIKQTGKIYKKGNYVFLNDVNRGIHIIDYTNPNNPINVSFIAIPGNIDMAVRGNILYADCYTSLVAIDISNPLAVKKTKIINSVFPHRRYNNFVPDTGMIITDWIRVDTVVKRNANEVLKKEGVWFDFTLANTVTPASISNGIGGSMARFTLVNNRLYTVSNSDILVFNVYTAEQPLYVNTVATGVWDIETIYPFKGNIFLGSNTGMHIFNISNPDVPAKTGTFSHARVCDPVIAEDNYAYVTLRSGSTCQGFINQLDVVDVRNTNQPALLKSYPLTNPHGLSKDGNILLICDGADGLKIFDATNPSNILLIKTIAGLDTYDVITQNGYAFVVAKDGLYCINYIQANQAFISSRLVIH